MKLSYSAYTPPAPKKPKKFQRSRFRGRDRSRSAQVQTAKTAAPATGAAATAPAATTDPPRRRLQRRQRPPPPRRPQPSPRPRNRQVITIKASRSQASGRRFALARLLASLSLPPKWRLQRLPMPAGPAVTTPETRYVNPDGTISGEQTAAPERKSRLSARPVVHKVKTPKTPDTSNQPTPEELAAQKVQNAPLALTDPNADKNPSRRPRKPGTPPSRRRRTTPSPIWASLSPHPQAAPAASQPAVPGTPAAGPPNQ